mmetsp:Transcript_41676/g.35082  ORF Transcript_41676/g.35082 Transcript_41676/m.35082 type:complete len:86 (-) Transcript_41676:1112-1369(-)
MKTFPPVMYDFLPNAHIMGRMTEYTTFAFQGTLCYWRADVKKIIDDLAIFKPTILPIVPRLLNRIYAESNLLIKEKSSTVQSIIN